MPRMLVIDDEAAVGYSFRRVFSSPEVVVDCASTAAEGLEKFKSTSFDVVILDVQLPDRNGLTVYDEIHTLDPKRPVVFVTAHGTAETAIEAMKRGAFDYLVKPLDLDRLTPVIERALAASRMMQVPPVMTGDDRVELIVGRSAVVQEMSKAIGRVAPQDVNVLILGETGAGKELVARAIYHHSRRADKPFLAINCAAIPENLLESELFGHEEGAFTGASRRRVGKFEQCAGGTLLLDEIGDMPVALQSKLLRVLQEQEFVPLGGNKAVKTQVRVLAATNQDLAKAMNEGSFRKDLYFRLRDVTIPVPPLRERREDISELAHHFLFTFGRDMGRDVRGFAPAALDRLIAYEWPGNVRELQGVIKQSLLASFGPLVEAGDLPASLRGEDKSLGESSGADRERLESLDVAALIADLLRQDATDVHERVLRRVEALLFTMVLRKTNLNQVQASEILGLNRSTLRSKLRDLGLSLDKVLAHEGET